LLRFLNTANLLFTFLLRFISGGLVGLGVPIEIAVLLPAAYGGHDGVAEVVFAVRGFLDVGPFEGVAAAADS
jgi:hypothetical protein